MASPAIINTTSRQRALSLYKQWIRAAPTITDTQKLEISPDLLKAKVRLEFQKNKFVTDQNIIEVLLFKGKVELDECLKGFKQPTHVMRMLEEKSHKKRSFLEEFYNP